MYVEVHGWFARRVAEAGVLGAEKDFEGEGAGVGVVGKNFGCDGAFEAGLMDGVSGDGWWLLVGLTYAVRVRIPSWSS